MTNLFLAQPVKIKRTCLKRQLKDILFTIGMISRSKLMIMESLSMTKIRKMNLVSQNSTNYWHLLVAPSASFSSINGRLG